MTRLYMTNISPSDRYAVLEFKEAIKTGLDRIKFRSLRSIMRPHARI